LLLIEKIVPNLAFALVSEYLPTCGEIGSHPVEGFGSSLDPRDAATRPEGKLRRRIAPHFGWLITTHAGYPEGGHKLIAAPRQPEPAPHHCDAVRLLDRDRIIGLTWSFEYREIADDRIIFQKPSPQQAAFVGEAAKFDPNTFDNRGAIRLVCPKFLLIRRRRQGFGACHDTSFSKDAAFVSETAANGAP